MNKPIRKAVRTYLIEENNIVAIKHKEKESRSISGIRRKEEMSTNGPMV